VHCAALIVEDRLGKIAVEVLLAIERDCEGVVKPSGAAFQNVASSEKGWYNHTGPIFYPESD
jgi:hypothetical protein